MNVEPLEDRRLFTVSAPLGLFAMMVQTPANSDYPTFYGTSPTEIHWGDVVGELGYRVEWSRDGATNWQAFGSTLPANSTTTTFFGDKSGAKLFFHVIAFDASSEAVSAVTSPDTDVDHAISVSFDSAASTPGVTLRWPGDTRPTGYTVTRRQLSPPDAGILTTELPGTTTSYYDDSAVSGTVYSYNVESYTQVVYPGFTYRSHIATGNLLVARQAPAVHDRGNILLVIDRTVKSEVSAATRDVASKLLQYENDLTGEGWHVKTIEVDRDTDNDANATDVVAVKEAIRGVYTALGGSLSSIVLIGHVPLPLSGLYASDGHQLTTGAWPADVYYGDLEGDTVPSGMWTDQQSSQSPSTSFPANVNVPLDGKFDQDYAPTAVEVPVSRIDLSNLDSLSGEYQLPAADAELLGLSRYFARNHAYRVGDWSASKRALLDDNYAERQYLISASQSAYALVGKSNSDWRDWSNLQTDDYLWGFGSGPGFPSETLVGIATPPDYRDHAYKSVFNTLWGSYATDWDRSTSLMRGVLANRGNGLAVVTGQYDWPLYLMGLGDPLNAVFSKAQNIGEAHATLLGDPTLRQDVVKPVSNVRVNTIANGSTAASEADISWNASPESAVSGYYVYRAATRGGPYTLLFADPVAGTSAVDPSPITGASYMVRAAMLTTTPSGSYWNLSTGAIANQIVSSVEFKWHDSPQKFNILFNTDVSSTFDASNFQIAGERWDRTTQTYVPVTLVLGHDFYWGGYNAQTKMAQLVLETRSEMNVDGVIWSGHYTLTVNTGAILDTSGNLIGGSRYRYHFVFAAGDTNNDGQVNYDDLLVLSQHYNQSVAGGSTLDFYENSFGIGDFDNDGDVDFSDLLILSQNYNLTIN